MWLRLERNRNVKSMLTIMSMWLDGYVADLDDGVAEVLNWSFTSGDVEIRAGGLVRDQVRRVSQPREDHLHGLISELGAMLTGRRTYDKAPGWGRKPRLGSGVRAYPPCVRRVATSRLDCALCHRRISIRCQPSQNCSCREDPLESTAQTPSSNASTLDSSTKSTSTSQRFFSAPSTNRLFDQPHRYPSRPRRPDHDPGHQRYTACATPVAQDVVRPRALAGRGP